MATDPIHEWMFKYITSVEENKQLVTQIGSMVTQIGSMEKTLLEKDLEQKHCRETFELEKQLLEKDFERRLEQQVDKPSNVVEKKVFLKMSDALKQYGIGTFVGDPLKILLAPSEREQLRPAPFLPSDATSFDDYCNLALKACSAEENETKNSNTKKRKNNTEKTSKKTSKSDSSKKKRK